MKNIRYTCLLILALLTLQSCVEEEKDLFDQSAAQRLMEAQAEYEAVLKSAANGWTMDYYAGGHEARLGGYHILCKFEDNGKVTMAGVFALGDYKKVGEEIASSYQITRMQGPCLSFSTYNPVLHPFGDPGSSEDPSGFSGDFEFVIVSATKEEVVMRGVKQKHTVVLRPIEAEKEWSEYCTETMAIQEAIADYNRMEIRKAGASVGYVTLVPSDTQMHDTDQGDIKVMNYTVNNTGIRLYSPLEIQGNVIDRLIWDNDNKRFVDASEGTAVESAPVSISFQQLLGTYKVTSNAFDDEVTVTLTDKGDGNTIRVSGELLAAMDKSLNYGFDIQVYENNNLGIKTQTLGKAANGDFIRLAVATQTNILGYFSSTGYDLTRPHAGTWYRYTPDKPELRFLTTSFVNFLFPVYLVGIRVVEASSETSLGSGSLKSTRTMVINGLIFTKQ